MLRVENSTIDLSFSNRRFYQALSIICILVNLSTINI